MRIGLLYFRRTRVSHFIVSYRGDHGYRRARRIVPGVFWLGPSLSLEEVMRDD
jgi:hypothetical protein